MGGQTTWVNHYYLLLEEFEFPNYADDLFLIDHRFEPPEDIYVFGFQVWKWKRMFKREKEIACHDYVRKGDPLSNLEEMKKIV